MALKGLSQAQKQQLALTYLRQSRTCHTLRDLEKALPSVASINSVAVKDLVRELTDENQVRVDKIGTGNWYWVFPSEEKREKEKMVKQLEVENQAAETSILHLQDLVNKFNTNQAEAQANAEHQALLQQLKPLQGELNNLGHKLDELNGATAVSGDGLKDAITKWKQEASCWTDDIYILEGFFRGNGMLNKETMENLRQECYGSEYFEGEGLKDLEDI